MAFYDDSGGFAPGGDEKFACLGMVVVPVQYMRKYGDAWWGTLEMHFQCSSSLQTIGIEAKSSELYDMLNRLDNGYDLKGNQQEMFEYGLNTTEKVNGLIEAIFDFLSKPPVIIKYLAVVVNKVEVWQSYDQFNRWRYLTQQHDKGSKKESKKLSKGLSAFLVKHAYEFLLQRLDYLSRDGEKDFDFSDAFVIGDASSDLKVMLETQAEIQAGLGEHFSPLPTIVNRPWFGSSLHDPCLQMADWVAFAVRTWAEADSASSHRIDSLLPCFRGYPDQVLGRGIVCCPNSECFPNLPLEDN